MKLALVLPAALTVVLAQSVTAAGLDSSGYITFGHANEVWLAEVNGTCQSLYSGSVKYACWSADGARIFFIKSNDEIWVMGNDGSNPTRIATGNADGRCPIATFRPDPDYVLHVDGNTFYKISVGGQKTAIHTDAREYMGEFGISASGTRIAARSGDDLMKVTVGGGSQKYADRCSSSISPNGQWMTKNVHRNETILYDWSGGIYAQWDTPGGQSWDNQNFAANSDDWVSYTNYTDDTTVGVYHVPSGTDVLVTICDRNGSDYLYTQFWKGALPPPAGGTPPANVSIDSFSASPNSITAGQGATLAWTTTNATSVSISGGVGAVSADGSTSVTPSATTTYTLTAQGDGGPKSATVTVTVTTPQVPELISDYSVASSRAYEWTTLAQGIDAYTDRTYKLTTVPAGYEGLDFLRVANDDKDSTAAALVTFTVTADATVYVDYYDGFSGMPAWLNGWTDTGDEFVLASQYTMSLYAKSFGAGSTVVLGGNEYGGPTYNVTIAPGGSAPPPPSVSVDSFEPDPWTIMVGDAATLSWTTSNATSVGISGGVGAVAADGSATVAPVETTSYTLAAEGAGGPATAVATITVIPAASVTLESPVTGDAWYVGTTPGIRWSASNVDNVEILYSTDGGSNWTQIDPSVLITDGRWGAYPWTVPAEPSADCRVYVGSYTSGTADESGGFEIRALQDYDGDGMDDRWETDHLGDTSLDGTDDTDGDGVDDLDEFLNGTDPGVPDVLPDLDPVGGTTSFSCTPARGVGASSLAFVVALALASCLRRRRVAARPVKMTRSV